VFVSIVLIIVCLIALLSYRDWVKYQRLTNKDKQCLLVHIAKLILLEEWQEAKKEILPLITKNIGGKEASLLYVQVLRGTKEYEKALQVAKESSQRDPEELLFRVEEGKTLLEMGKPKPALEAFLVAEAILRNDGDLIDFATAHLRSGYPEKCWEIIEPILAKASLGNALILAGDTHLELQQYAKAISFYTKGIEKGWNTHQVQTQLGHAHRYLGNYNEAERIYRKILEKDSADVAATLGLGACMEERGYYMKALLIYQSGRAWSKNDPELLTQAATCALYAGKFSYAEEYYGQVIDIQGHTPDLLFHYGYCLEKQQKWDEAEECYVQASQIYPEDVRGYRALAWLYGVGLSRKVSSQEGLRYAHQALSLHEDGLSLEILSAVQARAGEFEAAYQIQEYLSSQDKSKSERLRRSHLLKNLRKQLPLDEAHLYHRLVAA
jgi:tetratricopeptide (TPR) repeat protein